MNGWQDKVWGRTRAAFSNNLYSKHELETKAGGFCSLHYHSHRCNRFTIIAGQIEIVEFYGPSVRRQVLTDGNTFDVPSLVPHLFVSLADSSLIEEYYPDRGGVVSDDDIVRLITGGFSDDLTFSNLWFTIRTCYANAISPMTVRP
jgi:hypothetical protein